jgi:protein-S-isoprenylcysteine O-methyltransferase Ste14
MIDAGTAVEPPMKMHDHAGVYVPPPLMFLVPLMAAILVDRQSPWPILRGYRAVPIIVGVVAITLGAALGVAAIRTFRNAKTTILPAMRPTTQIVAKGPYRYTRNPMYVAMGLAYLGLSVMFNNGWALLLLPAVLLIVDRFVIRREERYLASKFGPGYDEYCARVRRWM